MTKQKKRGLKQKRRGGNGKEPHHLERSLMTRYQRGTRGFATARIANASPNFPPIRLYTRC